MVAVTYQSLHDIMNLSTDDITAAETEALIDLAIDMLNLLADASITNMAGVAGAKTLTLTSIQNGAVMLVARDFYYSFYKDIETSAVGGVSVSPTDVLANPTSLNLIRLAAKKLTPKYFERA